MAALEIARYERLHAQMVMEMLRAEGVPAFPAPLRSAHGIEIVGILIDESDEAAARRLILASAAPL